MDVWDATKLGQPRLHPHHARHRAALRQRLAGAAARIWTMPATRCADYLMRFVVRKAGLHPRFNQRTKPRAQMTEDL